MTCDAEDELRRHAPLVLGALIRRYGHFDLAEDAVQEALLAAALQWPRDGVPTNPRGWLISVAARRLTDLLRADQARQRREDTVARWAPVSAWWAGDDPLTRDHDDSLALLYLCCHPALSPAAQIALTLRAVGGLTTAEIARAFLVPEATMGRRISRAKVTIKNSGVPFRMPGAAEQPERLTAVLHTLYLIFNEGYVSTAGPALQRVELAAEAIRLTRLVHRQLPAHREATGLLALMLLTDARRSARSGPLGELIPMAEQDRTQWNSAQIGEGVALLTAALPGGNAGPYLLQAAIAAVHDEAPSAAATDWAQIVALYGLLLSLAENPVVRLNHAVATAMVDGPTAGLVLVEPLRADPRLANDHRVHAVRAHLLELANDVAAARVEYDLAARLTLSRPQQRYLNARSAALAAGQLTTDPVMAERPAQRRDD